LQGSDLYALLDGLEPNSLELNFVNILADIIYTNNYDYIKTMIITLLKSGLYDRRGVNINEAGFTDYLHEHPSLLNDIINSHILSLSVDVFAKFLIDSIRTAPGKTNDKVNSMLFNIWNKKFRDSQHYYKLYLEKLLDISDELNYAEANEIWSEQSHYFQQIQKLLERVPNFPCGKKI
jgi:hypothetical protein